MEFSSPTEHSLALPRIYAWFSALVLDDLRLMDDLLLHGLPIDVSHPLRHTTALMEATRLGRTATVEWLLNHGAAPALLNGMPQGTALHCAIQRQYWAIAHLLVNKIAHCGVMDAFSNTPLHLACANMLDAAGTLQAMDLINLLVGKCCALDTLNREGVTALHYTALNDNPQLTELLLVHGVNPNVASPDNLTTPLMIAALEKNTTISALLLQYGADPHQRNSEGVSSIDMFPGLQRLTAQKSVGGYIGSDMLARIGTASTTRLN